MLKFVRPGEGFVPNFQVFQKVLVNGPEAHPLFTFLKESLPATTPTERRYFIDIRPKALKLVPVQPGEIQWNFEKFLIGRDGVPFKRFMPDVPAEDTAKDIEALLNKEQPETIIHK